MIIHFQMIRNEVIVSTGNKVTFQHAKCIFFFCDKARLNESMWARSLGISPTLIEIEKDDLPFYE